MYRFTALEEFWRGIRAERTRRDYSVRLEKFLEFFRAARVFKFRGRLERVKKPVTVKKLPAFIAAAEKFKAMARRDGEWAYYCASLYGPERPAVGPRIRTSC